MSEQNFLTVEIATNDGKHVVPAFAIDECKGIAVTMSSFGRFRVTHIATGTCLTGDFERSDNAILTMLRYEMIARELGFSWEIEDPKSLISSHYETPVPFNSATVTSQGNTRSMTISEWIRTNRRINIWGEINTPPWEEISPAHEAKVILDQLSEAS